IDVRPSPQAAAVIGVSGRSARADGVLLGKEERRGSSIRKRLGNDGGALPAIGIGTSIVAAAEDGVVRRVAGSTPLGPLRHLAAHVHYPVRSDRRIRRTKKDSDAGAVRRAQIVWIEAGIAPRGITR